MIRTRKLHHILLATAFVCTVFWPRGLLRTARRDIR